MSKPKSEPPRFGWVIVCYPTFDGGIEWTVADRLTSSTFTEKEFSALMIHGSGLGSLQDFLNTSLRISCGTPGPQL